MSPAAPVMTVFLNGIASTLTITDTPEATFTAADFIFAGNVAQTLNGTGGIDTLFGAGGNDHLNGLGGHDRLFGENDVDTIAGGLGRDTMTGGAARDIFDFNSKTETGKTAATRDRHHRFPAPRRRHRFEDDRCEWGVRPGIPLSRSWPQRAQHFTGAKGQIHWLQLNPAGSANDKTLIEGDINGDKVADFQIELSGLKNADGGGFPALRDWPVGGGRLAWEGGRPPAIRPAMTAVRPARPAALDASGAQQPSWPQLLAGSGGATPSITLPAAIALKAVGGWSSARRRRMTAAHSSGVWTDVSTSRS